MRAKAGLTASAKRVAPAEAVKLRQAPTASPGLVAPQAQAGRVQPLGAAGLFSPRRRQAA